MKYSDIVDYKTLKKYCNKRDNSSGCIYFDKNHKFVDSTPHNYLSPRHTNKSGALGYREFVSPIIWCKYNIIRAIIYSYYTPIGVVLNTTILIVKSKALPFKSVTTKKVCTALNWEFMSIDIEILKQILYALKLDLGWLV